MEQRMLGRMCDDEGTASPDANALGIADVPDALRYDWGNDDPAEVGGLLRALMPSRSLVLDVGCGTGMVTLIANRDKNNQVLAIEPDPERAKLARVRGINVECGYLDQKFLARHPPFDVVVLSDVLEHVAAPGEFLKLAIGALKPGGLILLSVPNVAHWTVRFNLLFGRFDYTETGILDATHLRWFTEQTICALCHNCGLDVLSVQHSAGNDLSEYRQGFPWRFLPGRVRRRLVRGLTRSLPRLFGCQHVISARLPLPINVSGDEEKLPKPEALIKDEAQPPRQTA
jgi:SAM-dependent methyltransferase